MRRLTAAIVVLLTLLVVGVRRAGPLPALGEFLDPAHGVWSLARSAGPPRDARAVVHNLGADVTVAYDDRAVPHIFAKTEEDAYRALGYVVARDRLFQLYLQTMAASGRLTEVAGARALPLDRDMRGLGLPRAAERTVSATQDTAIAMRYARAYADGVNAYVAQMSPSELPIEFRLTNTRPEPWAPINSYHLLNRMGWTLASLALERRHTAAAALVGKRAAEALFPDDLPIQEPIQPNGQRTFRLDVHPLPPPGAPDSASELLLTAADAFLSPRMFASAEGEDAMRNMASNNWAVAPKRSVSGHALLAGDPHLDLTLPSIWYEAHVVVPGVLDVYGVTIPGAPGIVIGFNRDVAWTFTNAGVDVLDVYREQVDDPAHPARYRLDGAWHPLERRIERYRGQHGETIATDTMYYTHRGPMRRVRGGWLSMRWTVLETRHSLEAFYGAAHARTAVEVEDAFARWHEAPAQNLLAADRAGHIAIRSNGRYPIRPGDGRGSEVRDGSTSGSDWIGAAPVSDFPQAFDPVQGYLASANQQGIDPRVARGWWGGDYAPWRAVRINALLRGDSAMTPEKMQRMQTDPGSARADFFVPYFLDAARRVLAHPRIGVDSARLAEAAKLLSEWDRRYTRDNTRAVLFETAMNELVRRTWDELADPGQPSRRVATPSSAVLAELLQDSTSQWWDVRATPQVEHRDDVLAASLVGGLASVREKHGDPAGDGWRWDRIRFANINHLLHLPAYSALDIPVQGGTETINPSSGDGSHGASWRMVVELGPELRAWVTYPGGQSGNPASAHYRDRVPSWRDGRLDAVRFPRSVDALAEGARAGSLTLVPAR